MAKCQGTDKLIFACSDTADMGVLNDLAARQPSRKTKERMFRFAGIGGRVEPISKQTRRAASIPALDGRPPDRVKKTLEQAGFKADHFRITDLGFTKGETPVHDKTIQKIVNHAAALL